MPGENQLFRIRLYRQRLADLPPVRGAAASIGIWRRFSGGFPPAVKEYGYIKAKDDLYGTMMNEGANKGILVTTSGYRPDAHDLQKTRPIELVDGGGLLYLLDQQGIRARILMPA